MPYIENVVIQGFWDNHTVNLNFFPEVNFLIGKNGSGKTTAIEIIASALQADEDALERLPFTKVEITLYDKETRRKPKIIVEKRGEDNGEELSYRIQPTSRANPEVDREYMPFVAGRYRVYRDDRGRPVRIPERIGGNLPELRRSLAGLISTNWLSINRIAPARSINDRSALETFVDRKTREVSDRLERYFSELSSASNDITRDFQRKFFRSLIQFESTFSLSHVLSDMDLPSEKKSLSSIYEKFNVPGEEYRSDLERFYNHLRAIQSDKDKDTYSSDDLVALINAHKIHSLVDQWNEVVATEKTVLLPRDAFVQILDRMFSRKKAKVLPSGEMQFQTQSGKELRIGELSSGEKQLYIILGEALLQRDAEWTYLADEPELSLHVDWQEVLVDNLRALNPNGQVIFATHSPDIVSHYSSSVIDMELAIQ